jgi:hypothetical protein
MEAGVGKRAPLLLLGLVLLLRLPFLNQAVQGDDNIYLTEAAHAQIEPLHPSNTTYTFMGEQVDLRGHSHPPLNAWVLAGLIAIFGEVREPPFHAAYLAFSLLAMWGMWRLAKRFSPQPLWAALLFAAVPAFVINGNSLETDLPFLAFWVAAVALFVEGRLAWASAAMALAAMTAYQAVVLTPILALYCWLYLRNRRAAWLATLTPVLTVLLWQGFVRFSTGALPAAVLGGYFAKYGFQALGKKAASALMLGIHGWFLVFPALVPAAAAQAWRKRRDPDTLFLLGWIGIFFTGAVAIFFAGSARYLLPVAAPVALLASRLPRRWVAGGFAAQMALSVGLAVVNYQHWDACRAFAASLRPKTENQRVWVNAELGLRHYLGDAGALGLRKDQRLRPGDVVVSSQLEGSVAVNEPAGLLASMEIRPALPLRLIGLETRSGYSDVTRGFLPFGVEGGVIDRLRAVRIADRNPALEFVVPKDPGAASHVIVGIYPDGWMAGRGEVALKNPLEPRLLRATFYLPEQAPARSVKLFLDGREVASRTVPGAGTHTIEAPVPLRGSGAVAVVALEVDRTYFVPPDRRELGVVLTGIGFAP